MNEASREAFTLYFSEPIKLAMALSFAIFACLIIIVMKVVKNGAIERQEDESFHDADFIIAIIRVLAVLMILMIFFGF